MVQSKEQGATAPPAPSQTDLYLTVSKLGGFAVNTLHETRPPRHVSRAGWIKVQSAITAVITAARLARGVDGPPPRWDAG